jgi:putative MATE family efflux protein
MEKSILKNFIKYVSLNIMGMIGLSCYTLADTFFVAKALGATGIAALNFSISIYSVIHGTGLMIGIGGATRYSILKSRNKDMKANIIFTTCMKLGVIIGIIFALIGIFGSTSLALVLGADVTTLPLTKEYLSTILCFSPFFIMNNIVLAFVRNDNNPNLSMIAMLLGSFSNIVLDYVFMFPFDMGMFGAAFATGLAPIISIGVLLIHFIKKKSKFKYIHSKVKFSYIRDIFGLGLSTFIVEVSSAVVLITFNLVILRLKGNLGVAAYGIVANISLVGISVFTGIAQGVQPLISKGYGLKNHELLQKVKNYALITSISLALFMYLFMFLNSDSIIGIFNSEKNLEIAQIAKSGLRIYFIGFFFVGINIIMAMYLSSTERTRNALIISVSRGCVIIVPLVILLSRMWNITGVWFAFVLTECIVTVVSLYMVKLKMKPSV